MEKCWLDKERDCDKTCKAFNARSEDCKLLERSATVSSAFKTMMRWLSQPDTPKIR